MFIVKNSTRGSTLGACRGKHTLAANLHRAVINTADSSPWAKAFRRGVFNMSSRHASRVRPLCCFGAAASAYPSFLLLASLTTSITLY